MQINSVIPNGPCELGHNTALDIERSCSGLGSPFGVVWVWGSFLEMSHQELKKESLEKWGPGAGWDAVWE